MFYEKGENESQVVENLYIVNGSDTVTANHARFWLHRFRSGNIDIEDTLRSGSTIEKSRVHLSCKHCFDCPETKHYTQKNLNNKKKRSL